MSTVKRTYVLIRQIKHKWAVTLLLGLALSGVVSMHTYVRNSARFQNRSIQLIMKDMGHNLWFLERSASFKDAASGSADLPSFSDGLVQSLVSDRGVASTYWGNVLQQMISIDGTDVLLTGFEVIDDHQVSEEKSHLLEPVLPGEAALGYSLALEWGLDVGDEFSAGAGSYTVKHVHRRRGNMDDFRLWIPLSDARERLGKPGRSNLVLGFLCMQGRSLEAGLERLSRRLDERHTDFQVVPMMDMLEARALSRLTTSSFLNYLLHITAVITALLIAVVGWMEINERRYEMAVMMSMGAGHSFLILLFVGKLFLLGAFAALIGFAAGSYFSISWLSPILVTHTRPMAVVWSDFPGILFRTLWLIAAAALVPIAHLLGLDPTRILAEE